MATLFIRSGMIALGQFGSKAVSIVLLSIALAQPALGGHQVQDDTWRDASRNRSLAVRSYLPDPLAGPHPVILVSHGLGGSREAMPYLGRALAEQGYAVFHLQHPGTDDSLWRGLSSEAEIYDALKRGMWDARGALDRFQDTRFAVAELARRSETGPFAGHLDLSRIGMAGHSYGGVSVMVAAGQRMGPGGQWAFKEPRVRAGFVMSPNIPILGGDLSELYRDIDIPLFHVTGTRDANAIPTDRKFDPVQRTLPYRTLNIPNQYLLVFEGADHNAFSGLEFGPHAHGPERETRYTRLTQEAAVLFFHAHLQGDTAALRRLRDGFKQRLDPADRFEWKP